MFTNPLFCIHNNAKEGFQMRVIKNIDTGKFVKVKIDKFHSPESMARVLVLTETYDAAEATMFFDYYNCIDTINSIYKLNLIDKKICLMTVEIKEELGE
jgi:hypothetical protein